MSSRRLSFISRITLLVVCIEVAAFSTLGWLYINAFLHEAEQHLQTRFGLVSEMLGNDDLPISAISRKSQIGSLLEAPYLRGMAIGGNGRVIVSTTPDELGRLYSELEGVDPAWLQGELREPRLIEGRRVLTAILPIENAFNDSRLYTAILTVSLERLNALRTELVRRGLAGSMLFILFSTLGIIFIARRFYQVEHETARVKEQLEHVLRSSGDGWWDWDIGSGKAFFDERWTGMLGYAQDEVTPSYEGWISLIHPDDLEGVTAQLSSHLDGHTAAYDTTLRMHCKSGEWKWILTRGKVVERDHNGKPLRMTGTHSDITDRIKAEEQIYDLAFLDPLTQLPNRRLLLERLNLALIGSRRSQRHGALIIIDLDNFKTLNDTQGHDTGDKLLVAVAERLRHVVREDDTVARLGGDEYVVLLNNLDAEETRAMQQAEAIAEKIRSSLARTYLLNNGAIEHHSTPSSGVTLFFGDAEQPDTLMKQADMALYQAKDEGRNCIRFFNPSMQTAIETNIKLISALRKGLENDEFELHYQSQHDGQGRIIGAEALLRWHSPTEGQVSPGQFIPLAEDSGLIVPLGQWVIENACKQLRAWEADELTRDLSISINVSARQFYQADFIGHIEQVLQHCGTNPSQLVIELTEGTVIKDIASVIDKMNRLHQLGVTISLDDFGTGYSSLSYLKQLPIHELKIDQSFVRDIEHDPSDTAIVRAIISLGSSLELKILAEGVENEAQYQFLKQNGCHFFQGYLFSRPVPIDQLQQRLAQGRQ